MKKIAFILTSIILFSGCWKDVAKDKIIKGVITTINNNNKEYRTKQCEKYGTTFDWKIDKDGKTIDFISKDNILYALKRTSHNHYEMSEIDINDGKILKNIDFIDKDLDKINENSDSDPDNILFMGKKGYGDMIIAYDFVKHNVLWYKERKEIDLFTINGFLYSKDYEFINGKRIFFINKIEPVSGAEEKIYTFQDSLNDMPLNEIEDLNAYISNSGQLYFAYVAIYKKSTNDIRIKINVLDFDNKKIIEIQSFQMDHSNLTFDCIALDKASIYINSKDDIFCFDKNTLENKWNSYSTNEKVGNINSLEIIDNYLFLNSINQIEIKDKSTGETILKKIDLTSNNKSFGTYNDMIYFTDGELFYRIKNTGVEMNKFISPSYCKGKNGIDFKFVINDSGNVFLSDDNFVMKKVLK
jgi:hypothetical protein